MNPQTKSEEEKTDEIPEEEFVDDDEEVEEKDDHDDLFSYSRAKKYEDDLDLYLDSEYGQGGPGVGD